MATPNLDLAYECGGIWRAGDDEPSLMCFTLTKLDAFAERIRAAAEGECKPSLYLFLSEHGGIKYWTRESDAAARKAIEFGVEPERFYEAPVPAPVQPVALPAGLPEPAGIVTVSSHKTYVSLSISEWRDDYPDGDYPIFTAAQVQAMLAAAPAAAQPIAGSACWCQICRPITWDDMRMVFCPTCGNKRCPRANDHRNLCTGSNVPGQPGSAYPSSPQKDQS